MRSLKTRSFNRISEDYRDNNFAFGRDEFFGIEGVERIFKNLLVESIGVNSPEVLNMRVVLLIDENLTQRSGQDERVYIMSEDAMSSENSTVLSKKRTDNSPACELVDRYQRDSTK